MSDSNLTDLSFVEETTFGTTPSSNLQLMRITGGSIVPTQNTIVSEEIRSDLRAGRPVRTSQMAQGTVNHEWSYSTLDRHLAAMLMNDWETDELVDGTIRKSMTYVDRFANLSPSIYHIFRGARLSQMQLSMAIDSIVSGSIGIMAAKFESSGTAPGSGFDDPSTTGPWNTVDMIEELAEGVAGSTPATLGKVVGVDVNLDRALREKKALGDLNPFDIGVGRLIVNGTIEQYFENGDLISAWESFEDRQIRSTFEDEDGNQFQMLIPKLKLVGDIGVSNPGPDDDRMVTANFEAYATADDEALIKFIRSDAA